MMTNELLFEQQDEIGIITFNRPEARNALTFEMYESWLASAKIVDKSLDIKTLIITGAGNKAFAAGTDISQFRNFHSPDDALGYERSMDRVLGYWSPCPYRPLRPFVEPAPEAVQPSLPVVICALPAMTSSLVFRLPEHSETVCR